MKAAGGSLEESKRFWADTAFDYRRNYGTCDMASVMTIMANQAQETRAMTEKLAALDIQKSLIATMSKANVCSFNIGLTHPVFDATAATIPPIDLGNTLYSGGTNTTPALVRTGAVASTLSPNLVVETIRLNNIHCDPGPCTVANNTFLADVELVLRSAGLVRSMAPVKSQITLTTTGSGAAKTITGCFGDAPAGLRQDTCLSARVNNCEYNSCVCPVGYYAVGIQVGIRSYQQYAVNTWADLICCLP